MSRDVLNLRLNYLVTFHIAVIKWISLISLHLLINFKSCYLPSNIIHFIIFFKLRMFINTVKPSVFRDVKPTGMEHGLSGTCALMDFGINGGPKILSSTLLTLPHIEGWLYDIQVLPGMSLSTSYQESSNKVSQEKHYFSINQLLFLYF